ncbi:hypothetical protein HDU86_003200 [Geranomyces michiganensis]|nr:hypothetical protein HDU86_003200 [Geranomyces michiganensis]
MLNAIAQQLHGQVAFASPYATSGMQSLASSGSYLGNSGTSTAAAHLQRPSSPSNEAAPSQQPLQQPTIQPQQDSQQHTQTTSHQLPSLQQSPDLPQGRPLGHATNRETPSSNQYGTNTSADQESWQEAAPYWRPTTQSCAMYNMDRTKTYELKLNPRVERGFFIADGDWTCYRRNYFQVSLGFSATDQVGQRAELPSLIAADGRLQTATAFYVGVAARTSNGQRVVELVQHTTKRDKGPQLVPEPRMCQPQDSPSALDTFHTVTFDRLQFKAATANNGKRRAAQQYHVLVAELFAEFADQTRCRVAFAESAPLVVRGRAPGHYANMNSKPRVIPEQGFFTPMEGPAPPTGDHHQGEQAQGLPPSLPPTQQHQPHPSSQPGSNEQQLVNVSQPQPNAHHQQQAQVAHSAQVKATAHPQPSHLATFHPHPPSIIYSQPVSAGLSSNGPDAAQQYFHQQQLHGQHSFQQYQYLPPHPQQQQLRPVPPTGSGTLSGTSTPHCHASSHQHQQPHQSQQQHTSFHDHATYEQVHHPQHVMPSTHTTHPNASLHPQQSGQHPVQHHVQHQQQQHPSHQLPHFSAAAHHQHQQAQHQQHQHQGHNGSFPPSRGNVGGVAAGGDGDIQHSQALHLKLQALQQEQQQQQQQQQQHIHHHHGSPLPALPSTRDRHPQVPPQGHAPNSGVQDNRLPPLSNLMTHPAAPLPPPSLSPMQPRPRQPQEMEGAFNNVPATEMLYGSLSQEEAHHRHGHHHGHHQHHEHHHSHHHQHHPQQQQQQQQQQHEHQEPQRNHHHLEQHVQHHEQHHHQSQHEQPQLAAQEAIVHAEVSAAAAATPVTAPTAGSAPPIQPYVAQQKHQQQAPPSSSSPLPPSAVGVAQEPPVAVKVNDERANGEGDEQAEGAALG